MISDKKNVPVLSMLRAVAALSVCLYHFICTVIGFISEPVILGIFSYGHYGVQMFFVISGFIIPWSMFHNGYRIRNFFKFTLKRLIRLEPPYLFSLLFAIAHTYLRMLSPHYNGVDVTPTAKQILLHFGYLVPFVEGEHWIRPVYWTLAVEFQYYVMIGLLFRFIWSEHWWQRFSVYCLFLIAPLLGNGNFLPFHLPVFLIGIVLCLHKTGVIKRTEMFLVNIITLAVIWYFQDMAVVIVSGGTFLVILYWGQAENPIATFLGNISYSVYLFHSLTGLVILNYFSHTVTSPFLKFLLLLAALLVTILAAYVVYRLVEKPSQELSSRIKYKKENP